MSDKKFPPIHPGEILLEEFLKPLNITEEQLAEDISIPYNIIHDLITKNRDIEADIALRLSRYFGLTERFWMNLQSQYTIEREKDRLKS